MRCSWSCAQLAQRLASFHPADIAFVLESLAPDAREMAWHLVAPEQRGAVLLEISDAVLPTLVGDMTLLVPLKGLVDVQAEVARLTRELDKLGREVQRLEGKLGNAAFAAKAPADVVAKEQEKLTREKAQQNDLSKAKKNDLLLNIPFMERLSKEKKKDGHG